MIDLKRYGGLEAQWPKLRQLQEEVASLEQRRAEAERDLMAARQGLEEAREQDSVAAAIAVRSGKDMPPPKHQAKAEGHLGACERTLDAFSKALQSAQSDLATFTAARSSEIHSAITEALRVKAHRLAEHATEAAVLFGHIEDAKYDLWQFTPPPLPPDETAPANKNSTEVIALRTSRSAGPARGDVEAMLAYLASLKTQFPTPTEPSGEASGASDAA